MPETIHGTVERVYFSSPTFSAGVLDVGGEASVKFSGKFHATVGEPLTLLGDWQNHAKYGRQFVATGLAYELPGTPEGLARYLAKSKAFKGVGEATAAKLVEYAGTAERLDQLIRDGLDELRAALRIPVGTLETLRTQWIAHAAENRVRTYLSAFDLSPYQIDTLLTRFGKGIVSVLKADPYMLIRHVPGYGFKRVDEIARKTGVPKDHPGRIKAGLVHLVHEEIDNGHTWIEAAELVRKANDLLLLDGLDSIDRIKTAGKELVDSGDLVAEDAAITLPAIRDDERFIFETLNRHARQPGRGVIPTIAILQDLLPGQREAVQLALTQRITVITGAAGVGKTLCVSRIARTCRDHDLSVTVCAPTGKAAKRAEEMMRGYGLEIAAKTIHRLLGYDGREFRAGNVDADVLIADEGSMICIRLMAELLRHIDFTRTSLILVGDHNQLPSVGPGSVLRDIIAHDLAPVARLTEVVRQAGILKTNANAVLAGRVEPTDPTGREWIVIDQFKDRVAIQSCLRDLVLQHIPSRLGFDPLREVQILSPTHRGPLGTRELNTMMQFLHHGQVQGRFTVGDRVVQKANDYDLGIFNGSLGTVTAVLRDGLRVAFDLEGDHEIPSDRLGTLQLAYCLTIHSMQGSEAPCVVLLLHKSHWHACRQLFYTGVTRARQTVIILGDRWGIRHAVQDTRAAERRTLLDRWADQLVRV